ncbi:MAG: hypothetical protein H6581_23550 [Bacteroidia bacterium]|nr:hypothetical protein [Bacteroidia bacterium]
MKNIKKFIFGAVFSLLFFNCAFAQVSLEFSQVLRPTFSGSLAVTGSAVLQTQNLTVPAGKVWKIVSAQATDVTNQGTFDGPCSASNSAVIKMDNNILTYSNFTSTAIFEPIFPIWIPAGSYSFTFEALQSCSSLSQYSGYMSIVEFTVVP